MKIRILLVVLLSVITAFQIDATDGGVMQTAGAQTDENQLQFRVYDKEMPIFRLLGYEPITDSTSTLGHIEIRVWYSIGYFLPESLFVLQKIDSVYTGGFYDYWPQLSDDIEILAENVDKYITEPFAPTCEDIRIAPTVITCRRRLEYEPDWEDILTRVTELGIFTIPDMDSLRIPVIYYEDGTETLPYGFGGSANSIETYDGNQYRQDTYFVDFMREETDGKQQYLQILRTIGTSMPWLRIDEH